MSRHRSRLLLSTLVLLVGATCASAVTADLQCLKVTNETLKKLRAVVDLDTPSIGVTSGCKLSKAKLYCLPTETKVRAGTAVDGHTPVETIPFVGPPAESARICYGLKCKKPSGTAGSQVALDQLGEHRFKKLTTSMVCRAVVGADGFCGDGRRAASEQCEGTDVGGATCESVGFGRGTLGCTGTCTYDTSGCELGFRIVTPNVDIQPGQEITYCYYFHTPNTGPLAIKQFTSHLPAPIKRLTVVLTKTDLKPPGTLSTQGCARGVTNDGGIYYAGHGADDEFTFPADDGAGKPVGAILPPGQSGFVWMHNLNETTEVVNVHAEVGVFAYPADVAVTRADTYVTFNGNLSILPNAMNKSFSFACDVPTGAKFFALSTQSNKQSVATYLDDGTLADPYAFESADSLNPGTARFSAPDFFTFTSGKLFYQCNYSNLGDNKNRTITSGDNVSTDEVCMALGYFFPSTAPVFCYNNIANP